MIEQAKQKWNDLSGRNKIIVIAVVAILLYFSIVWG